MFTCSDIRAQVFITSERCGASAQGKIMERREEVPAIIVKMRARGEWRQDPPCKGKKKSKKLM